MLEYKILRGIDSDVQKILNQWKHEFVLVIISCNPWKEKTHMLVSRKKK